MAQTFPPPSAISQNAWIQSHEAYLKLYQESIKDPEGFWARLAEDFHWFQKWKKVLSFNYNINKGPIEIRWFEGAKTNIVYNCLDRHLNTRGNQIAIIFRSNEPGESTKITYRELHQQVCHFANVLKDNGVKKGDRVAIYLPMIPELAIAMLACARIGAIHNIVFGGFSADSLADRIVDSTCHIVITSDGLFRGEKVAPLKEIVDKAIAKADDKMKEPVNTCIVVTAITHKYIFDYHEKDIYWCTADIGWVTGHSYTIYGPLANGATTVMFEGLPTYPEPDRFWKIIDQYKVNQFYTAPTAIRALASKGEEWPAHCDLSSLRVLGTVGEPINPEAWLWYHKNIGHNRCPIVDTWWQTETGGILMTPLPGSTTTKPGSATFPFFGVKPEIIDPTTGRVLEGNGVSGVLALAAPWPGQMRTVFGDHSRFEETYFKIYPGYYFTGDGATRDEEGYYWITGRVDDVINVSGHRLGTAEVESALVSHPQVAEAAVVGFPHPIKGQGIYAYVTLNANEKYEENLKKELVLHVRQEIGPIASPDVIHWAPALPKTRSGKIMRRNLEKNPGQGTGQLGDITTLADPSVVQKLIENKP